MEYICGYNKISWSILTKNDIPCIAMSLLFLVHGFQYCMHLYKNNINHTVLSYALIPHANIYLVYPSMGIGHIKAV